ncbi:MAG: gamma-glutamylcyclotransferase [Methylacidiphilales bacterium]|nr:gamma-glutamylcyclotransferase [Candidatus Methylacidiphilales bacterium]MDW8349133.1 gamma-glutamylcyclotransferase family protein [Verrucomicrobiae bacterium]
MPHLFTYGTLSDPDFMRRLTRRRLSYLHARLDGYQKIAIHGFDYPAIVPHPHYYVLGKIFFDIPDEAWKNLDTYEGHTYSRKLVTVETENGQLYQALTYVWNA